MAHITKFKLPAMGQIFAHINRDEKQTRKYGNADIDASKTPQNFELLHGDIEKLRTRLDQVAHSKRSDLVVCCGVAITLPNELKNAKIERQQSFFTECHNFLSCKFGENNTVYSVVHFDETTPHLHFGFVPVVEKQIKYRSKEKRGQTYTQERVCADDVVTRKMLNTFHDELQEHISKTFPEVRLVAEDKQARMKQSKSIAEMKEQTQKDFEHIERKTKQIDRVCWEAIKIRGVAECWRDEAALIKEQAEQTAKQEAREKAKKLTEAAQAKAQEDAEKIKQDAFLEAQNAVESLRRLSEKLSKTKNAKKASILGKVILSADEYADLYAKATLDEDLKNANQVLYALSSRHHRSLEDSNAFLTEKNYALKKENELLKEQSEKDKATINNLKIQNNNFGKRIDTLIDENKTLRDQCKEMKEALTEVWSYLSAKAVNALAAVGIMLGKKKSQQMYRGR